MNDCNEFKIEYKTKNELKADLINHALWVIAF